MSYADFLKLLNGYAEEEFALFQKRCIFTRYKILGVRTPTMRKIAKQAVLYQEELFSYPNEYYEVVFIKLSVLSLLPFEKVVNLLEECVSWMDNWALTDCFKPKCFYKRKEELLPYIERIFSKGGEFFERYALVALLSFFVEERYLPLIKEYLQRADTKKYYVHMAAAWLTAEVLIKYQDVAIWWLKDGILDVKTHNKSIQKAKESLRLTALDKERLDKLKIKN